MMLCILLAMSLLHVVTSEQAAATVVVPLSLKELSLQADLIIIGRCEEIKSAWDTGRQKIFTYVTVFAEQCLKVDKGKCPPRVTIREPGGTVDDIAMRVGGVPDFEKNESVLVFLKRIPDSFYEVAGLSQGKFRVILDGNKLHAQRDLHGLKFLRKRGNHIYVETQHKQEEILELRALVGEIRACLTQ